LVESTGSEAVLEITPPDGSSHVENFLKVGERWVPKEIASEWTQSMTDVRTELEAFDPGEFAAQKPQIMGVFRMIEGVLAQIEAAETQEQFDQALQGAMMPMMGLMMMFQGIASDGPAAPAMPQMPVSP
jgi:hypothetical protein